MQLDRKALVSVIGSVQVKIFLYGGPKHGTIIDYTDVDMFEICIDAAPKDYKDVMGRTPDFQIKKYNSLVVSLDLGNTNWLPIKIFVYEDLSQADIGNIPNQINNSVVFEAFGHTALANKQLTKTGRMASSDPSIQSLVNPKPSRTVPNLPVKITPGIMDPLQVIKYDPSVKINAADLVFDSTPPPTLSYLDAFGRSMLSGWKDNASVDPAQSKAPKKKAGVVRKPSKRAVLNTTLNKDSVQLPNAVQHRTSYSLRKLALRFGITNLVESQCKLLAQHTEEVLTKLVNEKRLSLVMSRDRIKQEDYDGPVIVLGRRVFFDNKLYASITVEHNPDQNSIQVKTTYWKDADAKN